MAMTRTTTLVLPTGASHALFNPSRGTTFSNWTVDRDVMEDESLPLTPRSDLECLIEGKVKCTKPNPPSTKQTKKEAFDRYMKIIYRLPYNIKVEFDSDPEPFFNTPYVPTAVTHTPAPKTIPVIEVKAKKKKHKKKKSALTEEDLSGSEEKPEPVETPKPVIIKEKKPNLVKELTTQPGLDSIENKEIVLSKSPNPAPVLKLVPAPKPVAPAPREPSPEPPGFIQEFIRRQWFVQIYPDKKSIPSDLSPDSFSLLLVDFLYTSETQFKPDIIRVLEALHRQKLLQNIDQLYQKLINALPKMVTTKMSHNNQAVLVQVLNFLTSLKSVNDELVKTLLVLSAYTEPGLRERTLRILVSLGVDEADQWLGSELETWESGLLNKSNMWNSLSNFTESWLTLWTARYKDHLRDMFLRSTEKWKPSSFTAVDVLNYFCSQQKEACLESQQAPPRLKNTVIQPLQCVSGPIHRLGETYSMARIRTPPNLLLPPLRDRPKLLELPPFLSLALPRVILSPFHSNKAEYGLQFLQRQYYIQDKSHIEYYR